MPNCVLLKKHMCATVNGNWRPCCVFIEKPEISFPINMVSFDEYRNSNFYQDIRKKMETNWHEGCLNCKDHEDNGLNSQRQLSNKNFNVGTDSDDIEYIEISLSSECNITCRMCGPWASSKWNNIVLKHQELLSSFFSPSHSAGYQADIKKIFSSIDLSKLKFVKLLGGEPFITPQTNEFFEYLDENTNAANISINTNTNCTFFPKKHINLIQKFKHLGLSLSVDGVGLVNDYVRLGSKWHEVIEVINEWKQFRETYSNKVNLVTTTCISAYNVHDIHNIINYANQNNLNCSYYFINTPTYLTVEALPVEYVKEVIDLLSSQKIENKEFAGVITKLKNTIPDKELQEKFIEFTKHTDSLSDLKLKDVNPLLYKHIRKFL